jgi:hypothetical protein
MMNELQLVEHYGEVSRVLNHLKPMSSNQVATQIVRLHRRHSSDVARVMDEAISTHASDLREGRLPTTCAIVLALQDTHKVAAVTAESEMKPGAKRPKMATGNSGRGSGRKADAERNHRIANMLRPFGTGWRECLTQVCEALDGQKEPLTLSTKWKKNGCSDWIDVLAEDREGLVKALQHRLKWVSAHPLDSPDKKRN